MLLAFNVTYPHPDGIFTLLINAEYSGILAFMDYIIYISSLRSLLGQRSPMDWFEADIGEVELNHSQQVWLTNRMLSVWLVSVGRITC